MPLVDRGEVLARTDLAELATQICGQPRGNGAGRRWHCPSPRHPDENPSMGIFRSSTGNQRWKCHACGEGGTAVDMLMIAHDIGPGEALRDLARAAGLHPDPVRTSRPVRAASRTVPPAAQPPAREPDPGVEDLVARAAVLLWQPIGDGVRRYLLGRGLSEPVMRANRVGFDPGPRHLSRIAGLPRRGPAIVFPALHPETGTAIYHQLRYLDPDRCGRKYDQPTSMIAPNPHLATVRTPALVPPTTLRLVIVCEGFPDALSVACAGLPAVAVLGVSHAAPTAAEALATRVTAAHPDAAFAVCFDADEHSERPGKRPAGRIAAGQLGAQLARRGATTARLLPPGGCKDLNEWWQADPAGLTRELSGTAGMFGPAFELVAAP
jgi:hypothetical protein